jgi:hypothetical protein
MVWRALRNAAVTFGTDLAMNVVIGVNGQAMPETGMG